MIEYQQTRIGTWQLRSILAWNRDGKEATSTLRLEPTTLRSTSATWCCTWRATRLALFFRTFQRPVTVAEWWDAGKTGPTPRLHSQTAASHSIDYCTVLPVIAITTTLWDDHVKTNYYSRSNWERYRSSSCRIFGCRMKIGRYHFICFKKSTSWTGHRAPYLPTLSCHGTHPVID